MAESPGATDEMRLMRDKVQSLLDKMALFATQGMFFPSIWSSSLIVLLDVSPSNMTVNPVAGYTPSGDASGHHTDNASPSLELDRDLQILFASITEEPVSALPLAAMT
ncbi:hypothetical protein LTS17_012225 [Exophiala oligosperma]